MEPRVAVELALFAVAAFVAAFVMLRSEWGRARVIRRIVLGTAGVVLGGLGIGWHGQPSDEAIVAAIRARSPAHARATITVVDVNRDWPNEIFGISDSQFLVHARIAKPDEPEALRCFGIEPAPIPGTAIAFGPYADWRCDYPF
jgi:hypothetical protein